MKRLPRFEQIALIPSVVKWAGIAACVGALAGSATAIFVISLDRVTAFRGAHSLIVWLLPVAGLIMGLIYQALGKAVEAGNDLLIDEIHNPKMAVPLRMAPLILLATLITHLFGGSAGREGTAVQMGGALADQLTKPFRLKPEERRIVLMAGISAGFASVFSTPLAGAVFGLEVLSIGSLQYDAIWPCFVAAIVAQRVTLAWGVHESVYAIPFIPPISAATLGGTVVAGMIFGVIGMLFASAIHHIEDFFRRRVAYSPARPMIGGLLVAVAAWIIGHRYLGLGIETIHDAFSGTVRPWDFFGKFSFTAVTLGSGLKGGEVTPLFYIGATLGHALSPLLHLPAPFLAGVGFVAVFAGAANTPLSSTLIAIEVFGAPMGVYAAIGCVVSYLFSGHAGIYHSQRVGLAKNAFQAETVTAED